jgi:hypothetical protein
MTIPKTSKVVNNLFMRLGNENNQLEGMLEKIGGSKKKPQEFLRFLS